MYIVHPEGLPGDLRSLIELPGLSRDDQTPLELGNSELDTIGFPGRDG